MRIVTPTVSIKYAPPYQEAISLIDWCAEKCYGAHCNSEEETRKRIMSLISQGHNSVLEHVSITADVTCSRVISQAVQRHRLASYTQESTRYCNYTHSRFEHGVEFVEPSWFRRMASLIVSTKDEKALKMMGSHYFCYKDMFETSCRRSESEYAEWQKSQLTESEAEYLRGKGLARLLEGWTAQDARDFLPLHIRTNFAWTQNISQWRYVLRLRTSRRNHPDMIEIAGALLLQMQERMPLFFEDITLPSFI